MTHHPVARQAEILQVDVVAVVDDPVLVDVHDRLVHLGHELAEAGVVTAVPGAGQAVSVRGIEQMQGQVAQHVRVFPRFGSAVEPRASAGCLFAREMRPGPRLGFVP